MENTLFDAYLRGELPNVLLTPQFRMIVVWVVGCAVVSSTAYNPHNKASCSTENVITARLLDKKEVSGILSTRSINNCCDFSLFAVILEFTSLVQEVSSFALIQQE